MKKILMVLMVIFMAFAFVGCDIVTTDAGDEDINDTFDLADKLAANQPTPTDFEYSMERYNLIKRAYWVNGMRAQAEAVVFPGDLPIGYIVLFSGPAIVAQFIVEGKVSSLNSWLTPDFVDQWCNPNSSWEYRYVCTVEMPDIDGSFGTNDDGIFFFTPTGQYIEWTGEYIYSDYRLTVQTPVITYEPNE
jgi:hypothetical protein